MRNKFFIVTCLCVVTLLSFKQWRDVVRGQKELETLRVAQIEVANHADDLASEVARLKKRNAYLAAQLPNEIELARLRAAAADLQRLRAELARTGHSNILAAAQSAASNRIEPEPFTLDGTVRLNFGETVLSGGWSRTEGKRLFSLMTPTLEDGGHIMIAARLVEIPETAWETFGLKNLTSDTRAAEHFSTFTPELAANFMHLLEQMDGVAVLTSPRIVTNPGSEATISIGGNADTNEAGITLAFTPQIQPDGNSLDMAMKVRLPQPKAKNAP